MPHPLVELAQQKYYFKSHIKEPLITGRTNANDEGFRVRANNLVRNIEEYPHAFVLACLMDAGVDADVAWTIPYRVFEALGTFMIHELYEVSAEQYTEMFNGKKKWHRYPARNAKFFYDGVHKIVDNNFMNGDASKIWLGKPRSREVILRFMDFNGCGFKVANMAPNILYRYYGIEFSENRSIDIAPDVHTMRVFQRLGLTPFVADQEIARIYTICKARELNPEFPGIVDGLCWEVGRYYCNPSKPKCGDCPFSSFCERKIFNKADVWG